MAKFSCFILGLAGLGYAAAAQAAPQPSPPIPNFSPDRVTGWVKTPGSDEYIQPLSGPGPVVDDPAMPYVSNGHPGDGGDPDGQETVKIADLTNPILQPWAAEQMRKANEEVLAGKIGFTARARCWPAGVPTFLTYPVVPIYFIQSPREVLMMWGGDPQVSLRRVFLNVPHSANPKPSWFGESVGHYENGDTLVVDTIGLNDRTFVDNYRTPHTTQLHVVERFRLAGDWIEVEARVEDPGAFTTPWSLIQRYRRVDDDVFSVGGGLREGLCADNPNNHFGHTIDPIPEAATPDF